MAPPTIRTLARQQFGVVHRRQLQRSAHLSPIQISDARSSGELIQLLPSTYRLATNPDTFLARAMATQLWAGGVGFLSSFSAARIYGLKMMPCDPIHYTVPADFRRRTPSWLRLDRSGWLDSDADRRSGAGGLIVATPWRMLLGLARELDQHHFDEVADEACHLGLVRPGDLVDCLRRHHFRSTDGAARIEMWLTGRPDRSSR